MRKTSLLILLVALMGLGACKGGSARINVDSNNAAPSENGSGASIGISTSGTRVVNGTAVSEDVSPQMVQIRTVYLDGTAGLCSGVAVAPGHVLTAAHCFDGDVVTIALAYQGIEYPIDEIVRHPGYVANPEVGAYFNDVAVVRSKSLSAPALALVQSRPIPADGELSIFGFGIDEEGNFGALKSGVMKLSFVTENHLFSVPFDGQISNACSGDSGGPAVLGFVDEKGIFNVGVAGLVSSGTVANCDKGDTTLFVNLQNPGIASFIAEQAPGVLFN